MREQIIEIARVIGKGAIINTLYFVSLAVGAFLVWRIVGSARSARVKWAATIGLSLLMFGFVFAVSAPNPPFLDFTKAYWSGGRAVLGGWEGLRPHYEGAHGFVNLPIVALLFAPFAPFSKWIAASLFFALGLAATLYVWRRATDAYSFNQLEQALSLFLIAAFGPLVYSLREGNASHVLLLPLFLGVLDLRARRDFRAGALFALAAIIKPPLLVLGALAFVRGRWAVVAGGAAVLACTIAASILAFGWDAHVLWYETIVAPFAGGAAPSYNAQSLASIASRIDLGPSEYWQYDPVPLEPLSRIGVQIAIAAMLAAMIWAAAPWRRKPLSTAAFEGEVMLAIMFALLAGGLSWSHYFAWALLPAAWVWAQARDTELAAPTRRLMLAAFILGAPAVFQSWRMVLGAYEPFSWLLMSHLGIGAILLFAACVMARRRLAATAPEAAAERMVYIRAHDV
jgi:hypothetical protein